MRPLAGAVAAAVALAAPGAAFLQPVGAGGLTGAVRLAPPALGPPVPGPKPAKPEPPRRAFPLFATVACAALILRARVVRHAKGKPQATSGIRVRKPMNNALRNSSVATYEEITCRKRYEPLVFMYRRRFARPRGKPIGMVVKGRCSGHNSRDKARMYRIIDFGRKKRGIFGTISTIEYDPYRNARICLVEYEDGEKRYILHALGFFVGQQVLAAEDAPIYVGNACTLDNVPPGTQVHCISTQPQSPGTVVRAAGVSATVLRRGFKRTTLKMPSGEVRQYNKRCWCTIGKVGRPEHQLIKLGKAGKTRHLGFRPHIRGVAQNANQHPHGGGEGRHGVGYKYPRTPMGKCAIAKTRRLHRPSDKYILLRAQRRK